MPLGKWEGTQIRTVRIRMSLQIMDAKEYYEQHQAHTFDILHILPIVVQELIKHVNGSIPTKMI